MQRESALEAVTQRLNSLQADFKPVKAERDSLKHQLDESEARNDSLSTEYDSMSQQLERLTLQLSAQAEESEQNAQALTKSLKQVTSDCCETQKQLPEANEAPVVRILPAVAHRACPNNCSALTTG